MVLKKSPEKAVLWGYGPEGEEVILFLLGPVNQKTSATVTKGKYTQLLSGGKFMQTSAGYWIEKENKLSDPDGGRDTILYQSLCCTMTGDIEEVA